MTYNFGGQEEGRNALPELPTLVGELERHFIMEEMKKRETLDKYVFYICLCPGEAWGAWKLHLSNFITQKLFLPAQFRTNFTNFRGHDSIY